MMLQKQGWHYSFLRFIKQKIFRLTPEVKYPENVKVGRYTYGIEVPNLHLFKKTDQINIGSFCSIAKSVHFIASGEHNTNVVSTYPFYANFLLKDLETDTFSNGPITIGNDVWIGFGATIMSGVTIGDGAVIATGSVVRSNIPPYEIYGGVPAKKIGERCDRDTAVDMQKIAWWNWSDEKIKQEMDVFYQSNLAEFVDKYKKAGLL